MKSKFAISLLSLSLVLASVGCSKSENNGGGGTGGTSSGTGGARTGGSSGSGGSGTGGSGTGGGVASGGTSGSGGAGTGGSGSGGSATDGGGTGGAGTGGAGSGGSSGDVAAETGGGDTAAAVKYTDVKSILTAKCAPCHTTGAMGGHSLGSTDAMAKTASTSGGDCAGKSKGACAVIRIKNGTMPKPNGTCTGNPTTDAAKAACLTKAEQDKLQAWVDGGLQ